MEGIIQIVIYFLGIYITLGLIFSIPFLWNGVKKVDHDTEGTGLIFKLLLLPGTLIFWPSFLMKWIKT